MARVEIANLTRRYQDHPTPALSNLTLSVASGEFMVVVGPSGCGKSTALRLVAGLDEPDEGTIDVDGRSMRAVPPQDRDVAMVFQGYALYPHMRVREILAFPLKMRKTPTADRARIVSETAGMLGIGALLDRRPAELSGGERQRVAMGRALVRRPKVFLFDEPLSNLDAALRAEIRVEIGSLVRRLGATTLYVTHDHVEAMTLGHRIAVMRKGTLEQVGTPREVYEKPATAFVATFLGSPSMNLSDATFSASEVVAGTVRLRATAAPAALKIGVRPEHIRIGEAPAGMASANATVTAVEPLGAETHVHLDAGGAVLRARLPGFDAPSRGDDVQLWFDPAQVHAFASDDRGERLDVKLEAM
ncbi:MAG: ABC transporter ATP-binding protein [Deltaproteobacteria bacterium]|nr:ABC transporter ATP-binding protein [Deltaproteobacteria bacterium]